MNKQLLTKLEDAFLIAAAQLVNSAAEYFADTSIPLEERWEAFVETPKQFTNTTPDTSFLDQPGNEEFIMYAGYVHIERYQTIDTVQIILQIEEAMEEGEMKGYDVNAAKEIILGSYIGTLESEY